MSEGAQPVSLPRVLLPVVGPHRPVWLAVALFQPCLDGPRGLLNVSECPEEILIVEHVSPVETPLQELYVADDDRQRCPDLMLKHLWGPVATNPLPVPVRIVAWFHSVVILSPR